MLQLIALGQLAILEILRIRIHQSAQDLVVGHFQPLVFKHVEGGALLHHLIDEAGQHDVDGVCLQLVAADPALDDRLGFRHRDLREADLGKDGIVVGGGGQAGLCQVGQHGRSQDQHDAAQQIAGGLLAAPEKIEHDGENSCLARKRQYSL